MPDNSAILSLPDSWTQDSNMNNNAPLPLEQDVQHANRHIPSFLSLTSSEPSVLQVVHDGKLLTADALITGERLSLSNPILVKDTPTSIGMTVPKGKGGRPVSVRDIADVVSHNLPVSVIDVKYQEELEGWTMGDLVDYFEDDDRLRLLRSQDMCDDVSRKRSRRAAAMEADKKQHQQQQPKVLNQISLEFSRTPLQKLVKSPQFVRDLDWIDHAWPAHRREKGDYPVVQYYCLTSTAGCYTDFHVDFGGTSVWYHVLNGEKTFILIPPSKDNLRIYEDWLCRPNQAELFLPDMMETKDGILKITLEASQTMIIPTGWIHAVHTPVDSVVLGGNFLHSLDIRLQLDIHCIETRARVPGRFRFPHFLPLMFYAGGMYLEKLRKAALHPNEVEGLGDLVHALQEWWKLQSDPTVVEAANYAAQTNDCDSVEEMLDALASEHERFVLLPPPIVSSSDTHVAKDVVKPKLRLKLLSMSDSKDDIETSQVKSSFRIVVPSSSMHALPKKRKSIVREEINSFATGSGDDEWQPGRKLATGVKKIKQSPSTEPPPLQTLPLKPPVKPKSSNQILSDKMTQSKQQARTTSRQRLMKRLR